MTTPEKLLMVKELMGLTGDAYDARITAFLDTAEHEILAWRFSYASEKPEVLPEELDSVHVMAVVAGFSQSGAEGEMTHSENGISRTFKFPDMVAYIRANVVPMAGCF